MKLGAYKINNIPVSELQSVKVADLNGKAPFIMAEKMPAGYKDITCIENLHLYGTGLIGSTYGFKDWKCLQQLVKEQVNEKVKGDLVANWNKLNAKEKELACQYMLSKIPVAFVMALVPESADRLKLAMNFDLNNRKSRGHASGGTGRIQIVRLYLFEKFGAEKTFEIINDLVADRLLDLYEIGVEGTEESGTVGITDFLQARKKTPYSTTGLKKRKYKIVDGSPDTIGEVADKLTAILINGDY